MEKNNDLKLNEVIHKRNMKVQKLFRDGLEYALNTTVFDDKKDEEASEAFNNMDDIHKKSNEMEKKFEEVLIKFMEERQFPRHLHRVLEEQKNEARSVLKEYDDIIFQLNNDLNNKSAEYRQKIELQSMQHEETRKRIESVFSELNRVGNEEICAIRKEIVKHSKFISDTFWKSSEAFFDETGADKPFDTYLWRKPSEMLSIQQLEEAFLVDQAETFKLRKNLLSEVCKLRNNLEKEKLNYNLKKQVFEQEIFFLKENFYQNMPVVNKMKKKCIMLRDKRDGLLKELRITNDLLKKESKMKEEKALKQKYMCNLRNEENSYYRRYNEVFYDCKEEAQSLYSQILNVEKFIYENILEVPHKIPHQENLTSETVKTSDEKYWNQFLNFELQNSTVMDEIFNLLEEYRLNIKSCSELAQQKESLILESTNIKYLLKFYYEFSINQDEKLNTVYFFDKSCYFM